MRFVKNKKIIIIFVVFSILSIASVFQGYFFGNIIIDKELKKDLQNTIYLDLEKCRITVSMLTEIAPLHISRIKQLVREKFYDNLFFHRVINDFMAQAGGKENDLNYGSGKKIKAEFSDRKHIVGAVSMARAEDVNSADSQFFIVTKDSPFLDGQYTIWGEVIDGMDCVNSIKKGDVINNGMVNNPTKIKSMRMAIDVEIENAKKK